MSARGQWFEIVWLVERRQQNGEVHKNLFGFGLPELGAGDTNVTLRFIIIFVRGLIRHTPQDNALGRVLPQALWKKTGWGQRGRTSIYCSRDSCPAIRRAPNSAAKFYHADKNTSSKMPFPQQFQI